MMWCFVDLYFHVESKRITPQWRKFKFHIKLKMYEMLGCPDRFPIRSFTSVWAMIYLLFAIHTCLFVRLEQCIYVARKARIQWKCMSSRQWTYKAIQRISRCLLTTRHSACYIWMFYLTKSYSLIIFVIIFFFFFYFFREMLSFFCYYRTTFYLSTQVHASYCNVQY